VNKKVNLLIIGTQKAGTTSLYEYIKQHNDIYFSDVKEITYFVEDDQYKKGEEYYHSFFTKVDSEKIIASAYVHMLPSKKAPKRVKEYNSDMKFIVMLRNPVDRAYSAYNYAIKNGWEDANNSFEDTIALEKERIENEQFDLTYFYNGMYSQHLEYWQKYFPKENFLLIKDTELKNNASEVLVKVFEFLGIDTQQQIDTSKEFNKAGVVRFKFLQSFLLKKNSYIKKFLGSLMPRKVKVWIRANILKKVYQFNQVDKKNKEMDKELYLSIGNILKKDLESLKNDFNIKF
jgi:hypothetical protein